MYNQILCTQGPFHSSLPLRRWQTLISRTSSATQKDNLTVKTTEKKYISALPLELGVIFQS